MSAAAGLRALAEKATPGPWEWSPMQWPNTRVTALRSTTARYEAYPGVPVGVLKQVDYIDENNARLIALSPELARWAADAAEELARLHQTADTDYAHPRAQALLARLASLVGEETA